MKTNGMQDHIKETVEKAAGDNIRNFQENMSHWFEESKPFVEDAIKKSKQAYDKAMKSLPEGSETTVKYIAAGILIGIVGHKITQRPKRVVVPPAKIPEALKQVTQTGQQLSDQLAPIFKFVKLWMFYRLSA